MGGRFVTLLAGLVLAVQVPVVAVAQLLDVGERAAVGDGATLIRRAEQAAADRKFSEADELFRRAWEQSSSRGEAAAGLKRLHRTPGFRLPVDDGQVASVRAALGRSFVRRDTPHFVLFSDCDLRWTQARGDLLERTWVQFYRVADRLGLDAIPPRHRLVCILFQRREDYMAFAAARDGLKSPWVGGYYSTTSNHVVFYNDASAQEAARAPLARARAESAAARERASEALREGNEDLAARLLAGAEELDGRIRDEERRIDGVVAEFSASKTIHEGVHLLAFNSGVQRRDRSYPFWISEGMATAFESERPTAAFGPDRGSSATRREQHARLSREGGLPALAHLIALKDAAEADPGVVEALYTQSHALFMHLYERDPAALGRYIRALSERPRSAAEQAELFTATFGDPGEVERRMRAVVNDQRRPAPR